MKRATMVCLLLASMPAASIARVQKDRFAGQGAQIGDTLPALEIYDAGEGRVRLSSAWSNGPALIVTGSLTCPIARCECPLLEKTLAGVGGRVNVVVVYTVEAHPEGDPNPYGGRTDTPAVNVQEAIIYGQPTTMAKRMELMREFVKRTGIKDPVLVDAMDNRAWKALGGGPNLAVLVDKDGKVVAKQGWLDPKAMREEIGKLAAQAPVHAEM